MKASKIIKMDISAHPSWKSIQGHFQDIRTDGTVYLIGGAARQFLFGGEINDFDYTIIGGSYYSVNKLPQKNKRAEVENGACSHRGLQEYFKSRDFTINQVAVNSKGILYATKSCLMAREKRVLFSVKTSTTLRELVRALRFSKEYNLRLSNNLERELTKAGNLIQQEPVFVRYRRQGLL